MVWRWLRLYAHRGRQADEAVVVHGGGDDGVVALEEVADRECLVGLRGVELRLGAEVAFGEKLHGLELAVFVFGMDPEGRGLAGNERARIAVKGERDGGRGLVAGVLFISADVVHHELVGQFRVLQPAVEGQLAAVLAIQIPQFHE